MLNDTEYASTETPEELFELPEGAELIRRGPWQVISEEEDDIVTRSTAIDRLEGLAVEEPEQVARIVSILSLYVRELSREYPAKEPLDDPHIVQLRSPSLKSIRPDMEKAAQTLGRLPILVEGYDPKGIKPDLKSCNLQGFDLSELSFEHTAMAGASMQGADITGAKLQAAVLVDAKMQGAYLRGADLASAKMIGAVLISTNVRGSSVKDTDFTHATVTDRQWRDMLGDITTTLPKGTPYPDHWPKFEMDWDDFRSEWTRFKESPKTYTPPDPPQDARKTRSNAYVHNLYTVCTRSASHFPVPLPAPMLHIVAHQKPR